jgi:prephenate dehydratase
MNNRAAQDVRPDRVLGVASIAYLGPAGTFTEAALLQMIDAGLIPPRDADDWQPTPVDTNTAALDAVRAGAAEFACVPIENSIDGSVMPTLDSLAIGTPLQVFAEHTLDVVFSIVVKPGLTAAEVGTLAAFPVAVAQVRRWLAAHLPDAELRPANSNADAAQQVADGLVDAAVTSPLAATYRGLSALADGVVDEANARTRFVLVGRPGPPPPRTGADRTSVVLRIDNAPSALVSALAEFGIRGIDLTRIESRPARTELGTYVFFLDCVGHLDDDAVAEALKALRRRCTDVRYLGSWPTGKIAGAPPPHLDDASFWLAGLRAGSTGFPVDGSAE